MQLYSFSSSCLLVTEISVLSTPACILVTVRDPTTAIRDRCENAPTAGRIRIRIRT